MFYHCYYFKYFYIVFVVDLFEHLYYYFLVSKSVLGSNGTGAL